MNFGTLAAPTIEPATGTYVGGVTVTMSSPQSGATIRFTTNGDTPTESSAAYASAISVDGTMTVKARAFRPDYTASGETSHTYTIESAPPIINPSTGTYSSEQTVTITAAVGPPSTIRYTLDGSAPTASSPAYTGSFNITTATTVKARSFPNDGSAGSAVASATLSFNLGPLAAPTATPDAGVYASTVEVTLSSIPGATIRYTVDGNEPTGSSTVYSSPVVVSAGTLAIRARAFHPDWTASATSSQTYTIDATAPTIVAQRFPLPMGSWHLTPVTITFVCSDNVGIATCSVPSAVSTEGAAQTVSGTAVDQAGREATLQETVNLDLTPPLVTLTAPADGLVTASSTVTVSAEVSDALSGLGVVNCNGVATAVVNGVVTCNATLRPGRNSITISARDVAGHSSSAGATVTLAGTSTSLTLAPTDRTMLVGETATLSLRDDFGAQVPTATWVSSDPGIVSLSTDDPPLLTALATGTVTITATKNGLSSAATLTVASGTSLPDGATQWTVAPTPSTASWFEGPIYTNRIDDTGPDLFMVETNTTTWERTLRAMSASGEVAWLATSPGVPLMGDTFGGLIAGVEPSGNYCVGPFREIQRCYTGLARVAGTAGTKPWRYESARESRRAGGVSQATVDSGQRIVGTG